MRRMYIAAGALVTTAAAGYAVYRFQTSPGDAKGAAAGASSSGSGSGLRQLLGFGAAAGGGSGGARR
jgi:hypothetical protein